ncbi:hypothetical protein GC170_16325 [bacterium]|nr:hypothetical protein [bacterium]
MLISAALVRNIIDLDLFHEIALIREIRNTGEFPYQDHFSYVPTVSPVVHHEWGTGFVLYLTSVASGWGSSGLLMLKLAILSGIAAAVSATARCREAFASAFCFCSVPAIFLFEIGISNVRAQMFTLFFASLLMICLALDEKGRKSWVPAFLSIFLVWVNMHAGCIVGLGILILYTFETTIRKYLTSRSFYDTWWQTWHLFACIVLMSLMLLATPYGIDYPEYLWHAVRMPRPEITEWAPLWKLRTRGYLAFFIGAAITAGYAAFASRTHKPRGIALILVTGILALRHQRHLPIFSVVWISLVPAWLKNTWLGDEIENMWRNRSTILTLFWTILAIFYLGFSISKSDIFPSLPTVIEKDTHQVPIYPVGAVKYLRETGFRGNLMVSFTSGAFVSWNLFPDVLVSLDSRYEVAYPAGMLEENLKFYRALPGWENVLKRYPTQAVLLSKSSELKPKMLEEAVDFRNRPGWTPVYEDDSFFILMPVEDAVMYPIVNRVGIPSEGHFP